MESYVVIRYALWSRPLISDCLFSVAASFAVPPCPFPPLVNLNEILVLRHFQFSNKIGYNREYRVQKRAIQTSKTRRRKTYAETLSYSHKPLGIQWGSFKGFPMAGFGGHLFNLTTAPAR
jgi:hypothetical protein